MSTRVALVTGAPRGLGATIATRLAGDGRALAVNYRFDAEGAERVVRDIRATGGTAQPFAADVTDETDVIDIVDRITAAWAPCDTGVPARDQGCTRKDRRVTSRVSASR